MDPIAKQEYLIHQTSDETNEKMHMFPDHYSHPYDWSCFQFLVDEVKKSISEWDDFHYLVLIGSGLGIEGALLKKELPSIKKIIICDLNFRWVQLSRPTYERLGIPRNFISPVVLDFNQLPFNILNNKTVAIAFRSLHHAMDIEKPLDEIRRAFQRVIVIEPVWSKPIRYLAHIGFANREEHIKGNRPQRIDPNNIKKSGWSIKEKYIFNIPRDRLPFIQERQGIFQDGDVSWPEKVLAIIYMAMIKFINKSTHSIRLGNYILINLQKN